MRNALIALGVIGSFIFIGFGGITLASAHEGWAPDTQIVSTLITMLLCSSYFFISKKHLDVWYRILMVWAAVLMFSYIISLVIPGTKPYGQWNEKVVGVPIVLFASPIWLLFILILLQFSREALSPKIDLKLNREPVLILLALIGIVFGFLNGIQVLPREWGSLGLNETAILGMIYGFLVLFRPPRRLNLFVAIVMGFFLLAYVVQPPGMDTGFGHAFQFLWGGTLSLGALSDVMIALAFFPASIIFLRRQKSKKLRR